MWVRWFDRKKEISRVKRKARKREREGDSKLDEKNREECVEIPLEIER